MRIKSQRIKVVGLIFCSLLCIDFAAKGEKIERYERVPDEFESAGGHALGLANAGTAALSEQSSVRTNPAMLGFEKQYTISGGYHWPSFGREFYQAGAVDSKTSPLAAGLTYTSSKEPYEGNESKIKFEADKSKQAQVYLDSPIQYRLSLGVAKALSLVSVGFGLQYVEGFGQEPDSALFEKKKGMTLGAGIGGLLTQNLRIAASVENLANERVKNMAPKMYRAGLAYTALMGDLTLHLDYSQRQRVLQELIPFGAQVSERPSLGDEKMMFASFSLRVQDFIRFLGGYGQEVGGELKPRRSAAMGIALVNRDYSLSYLANNPYMEDTRVHQALNLSFQLSI